jgi:hypothetical protein
MLINVTKESKSPGSILTKRDATAKAKYTEDPHRNRHRLTRRGTAWEPPRHVTLGRAAVRSASEVEREPAAARTLA